MRSDIVSALKNALERGYSIEQAKRSLTNAGYGEDEVNENANFLKNIQVQPGLMQETKFKKKPAKRLELPELPSKPPEHAEAHLRIPQIQTSPKQILLPKTQVSEQLTQRLLHQQFPQQPPKPEQKLPELPENKPERPKEEYSEEIQEKPRKRSLVVLFVILAILVGLLIFVIFAKDSVFGLFGQVVKKLG